jgi:hypothetical protein
MHTIDVDKSKYPMQLLHEMGRHPMELIALVSKDKMHH